MDKCSFDYLASRSIGRFSAKLAPTSSSWLNLVERFFGRLTDKALRCGGFHGVPDRIAVIEPTSRPTTRTRHRRADRDRRLNPPADLMNR
jgi:hypothetical protein